MDFGIVTLSFEAHSQLLFLELDAKHPIQVRDYIVEEVEDFRIPQVTKSLGPQSG